MVERADADRINRRQIDAVEENAIVESVRADDNHFFQIDRFQFLVIVKGVFAHVFDRFRQGNRLQCFAIVESIFLNFLDALRDDDARDRKIGSRHFVRIVIVFVDDDIVIQIVKAESERADVENSFVVRNHDVSAAPLIGD